MHPRYAFSMLAAVLCSVSVLAQLSFADGPLVQVSGSSPFGPECAGPQWGYNNFGSEVEPWLAINPINPSNLVGAWQQDRWNNGGAQGLVAGVSYDGGATWTIVPIPGLTICSGASDYERASDPWVTFSPDGVLHQISLSFNSNDYANAILVSRSLDGGLTWSAPITLRRDTEPDAFNDKESITADPYDPNYVYALWDRLKVPPAERAGGRSVEHAVSFSGPTWFARTTDGGVTWEEARVIFAPGPHDQTIGNQVLVLPSGELINLMNLIQTHDNSKKNRGMNVAILRSEDKGENWSTPVVIDKLLSQGVIEPSWGGWVRSGDIIPEGTVDPASGNLYLVWQDARFTGYDQIAMSMSSDGGFTWSAPIRINQSPAGVQAFTPSISVNAAGTVGVTYYDFRNNAAHGGTVNGGTDQFLVTCDGDCSNPANWQEKRVTPVTFDIHQAPWAGGWFLGDYEGLASDGTDFLSFFAMPHAGDRASIFFRRMTAPAFAPIAAYEASAAGSAVAFSAPQVAPSGSLELAISGIGPNPSVNGSFTVQFTLPASSSADLELLDVAGRQLARQEVGSLGAGRHAVELGAGQLVPAGIYMIRLSQGDRVVATRAAVLR